MLVVSKRLLEKLFHSRSDTSKRTDKILYYYNVFCNKFQKEGFRRALHEGEDEFLSRVKRQFPSSAREAEMITNSYQQIRYNNLTSMKYKNNFIQVVKDFKVIKD